MEIKMKDILLKIDIQKDWKKPQEMIFQKFIFDELKKVERHSDSVEINLNNSKTGFRILLKLSDAILKKILNGVEE